MISLFVGALLSFWVLTVYGDSTNLALINLTPYSLRQNGNPSSYQMKKWDDSFPKEIAKGKLLPPSHRTRSKREQGPINQLLSS